MSEKRELQTSRETCEQALRVFTPMERQMLTDAHIVQDALAAHELLGIVRTMAEALRDPYPTEQARAAL